MPGIPWGRNVGEKRQIDFASDFHTFTSLEGVNTITLHFHFQIILTCLLGGAENNNFSGQNHKLFILWDKF